VLYASEEMPMRAVVFLMALGLVGCAMTPVVWNKDGATSESVAVDIADCRRLAADEMWRSGWERNWPPSFYDPRFMPPFYRGRQPFWFDYPVSIERERALVDFCMYSKGYQLDGLPY
jgi:hypothetical protein